MHTTLSHYVKDGMHGLTAESHVCAGRSLISRFDLIYLVLDKAEEAGDRTLARHLLSLHYPDVQETAKVRCCWLRLAWACQGTAYCEPSTRSPFLV